MNNTNRTLVRGVLLGLATAMIGTSCGGGGGGSSPPPGNFSLNTSSIAFKAVGPFAAPPLSYQVTGTVTNVTAPGTLYITIVENNPSSFFTVSTVTISGNSGQALVIPATPSSLHAGTFQGTITVNACLNDPTCQTGQLAGSPVSVPVSYDIGSGVDGDTVTPRVVAANAAGAVILRGTGFTGATSLSFGSEAATSFTVVNDTEIDASYPAMPAGTYPVSINSGSISDTASLVAVSPPGFTATNITYPAGVGGQTTNQDLIGMEYDAQRAALFVLVPSLTGPPTLLRYAFDGGAWALPTQVSISGLTQVHLSPDGTHLLGLIDNGNQTSSVVELDPVTMAQTNITTFSNPGPDYDGGFALANDGNAIVNIAYTYGFAYGTFSHTVTPLSTGGSYTVDGGNGAEPVASGNGAIVAMNGAYYDSASETVSVPGAMTEGQYQEDFPGATADFAGDKFTYSDIVESQTGQILGYLPSFAGLMNAAGTRVYGLAVDSGSTCASTLTTYDLTATPTGSPNPEYPALGTPVALNTCLSNSNGYAFALTPDGATIFIAGPTGFIVQPITP